MEISTEEEDFLQDQVKVLQFCVDQLVDGNRCGVAQKTKGVYATVAMMSVQNIVDMLTLIHQDEPR